MRYFVFVKSVIFFSNLSHLVLTDPVQIWVYKRLLNKFHLKGSVSFIKKVYFSLHFTSFRFSHPKHTLAYQSEKRLDIFSLYLCFHEDLSCLAWVSKRRREGLHTLTLHWWVKTDLASFTVWCIYFINAPPVHLGHILDRPTSDVLGALPARHISQTSSLNLQDHTWGRVYSNEPSKQECALHTTMHLFLLSPEESPKRDSEFNISAREDLSNRPTLHCSEQP